MSELGILKEIRDLRTVWKNEATDFTPWLAQDENIAVLGDTLGLNITVEETESSIGSFNADILATETDTKEKIIIENQLEDSNHEHLGKIITYASGKEANIIIWLVRHAREEHRAAIEWLNSHTDEKIAFFLCEIKLYQIGNSAIAPKFEVIERPNDWVKEFKDSEKTKPSHKFRLDYWSSFINYAFEQNNSKSKQYAKEFNKRKPSKDNWLAFFIGLGNAHIEVTIAPTKQQLKVQMNISEDKSIFYDWEKKKSEIESEIGIKLNWQELSDCKCSLISAEKLTDINNRAIWEQQFDWIMDTTLKFKKVFKKY